MHGWRRIRRRRAAASRRRQGGDSNESIPRLRAVEPPPPCTEPGRCVWPARRCGFAARPLRRCRSRAPPGQVPAPPAVARYCMREGPGWRSRAQGAPGEEPIRRASEAGQPPARTRRAARVSVSKRPCGAREPTVWPRGASTIRAIHKQEGPAGPFPFVGTTAPGGGYRPEADIRPSHEGPLGMRRARVSGSINDRLRYGIFTRQARLRLRKVIGLWAARQWLHRMHDRTVASEH